MMLKRFGYIFSALLLAMPMMGQAPSSPLNVTQLNWSISAPNGPTQISASVVGKPGLATYYYWVVAQFQSGVSSLLSPMAAIYNAPDTLDTTNYVRVSWSGVQSSPSYLIFRSHTPTFPGHGNILKGTTNNVTFSDQSNNDGSGYTYTAPQNTTCSWFIDNQLNYHPTILSQCLPQSNGFIPGFDPQVPVNIDGASSVRLGYQYTQVHGTTLSWIYPLNDQAVINRGTTLYLTSDSTTTYDTSGNILVGGTIGTGNIVMFVWDGNGWAVQQ